VSQSTGRDEEPAGELGLDVFVVKYCDGQICLTHPAGSEDGDARRILH
jgi:hypothetical protein